VVRGVKMSVYETKLKKDAKRVFKATRNFVATMSKAPEGGVSEATSRQLTQTLLPVYQYLVAVFKEPVEEPNDEK
jgi:hypothetical protein